MATIRRRHFIKAGISSSLAVLMSQAKVSASKESSSLEKILENPEKRFQFSLGLASYTFRAFSLEQTIAMTVRLGLGKICLKDMHLPITARAEEIKQTAERVRAAGLDLYACGVIYLENKEEVEKAFTYAQTAGVKIIISSPKPELLPLIEKKAQQTGISLAVHNHGPGDKYYPTPAEVYEKIKQLNHKIGLCLDIGHTARAGLDPAEEASKFADRLLDVHIKDVSEASSRGQTIEIGHGVIDLAKFLRTIISLDYSGTLAFEFEKDEYDPLPGLAESVGYVRGLLRTISFSHSCK